MASASWGLPWDKQLLSGRDVEIYAEVFLWILLINLIINALSKLSGLPILCSNNPYEWEKGSSHEWLPQVVSVLDVPACLFYNEFGMIISFFLAAVTYMK